MINKLLLFFFALFIGSCANTERRLASDYCDHGSMNVHSENYFEKYERCNGF